MAPAVQRFPQNRGANLTSEQADAYAKEPAGAKSGSSRDQVSPEVRRMLAFPGVTGFSHANLMNVRAFPEAWPDAEIVQQPVGQFPWGQNLSSIEQIEREVGGQ